MSRPIQRALLSVSDKTGLVDFARVLNEAGVELLSTGGTHRELSAAGLPVIEVSQHTGAPEMMGGRVKTLHPKIHGGILALRDSEDHMGAAEAHGIGMIDLVVVNLYPFEATVAKEGVERSEAIEQIDIGGPSMVRSAAKNHAFCGILTDPKQYGEVASEVAENEGVLSDGLRRRLALAAFERTASYDAAIARWLHTQEVLEGKTEHSFPDTATGSGGLVGVLRYGENPHQSAAVYGSGPARPGTLVGAEVLSGKALSYNNYVDLDAALRLTSEFVGGAPFACVLKHNNPCGAAQAASLAEAVAGAWQGDPLSAFGSVLGFNREVDLATAEFLTAERRFVEAIVAPGYSPEALEHLTTVPKWGRNVRLLAVGEILPLQAGLESKQISGGLLLQDADVVAVGPEECEVKTEAQPTPDQLQSMVFANIICKHVKSNAIVLAAGTRVLGVGAGQMSRVDSVGLAIEKAGPEVRGSVLASDAFFPFPDGAEKAINAGVAAILQPGGSVKDRAVIASCNEREIPMVFTGKRHFRH